MKLNGRTEWYKSWNDENNFNIYTDGFRIEIRDRESENNVCFFFSYLILRISGTSLSFYGYFVLGAFDFISVYKA